MPNETFNFIVPLVIILLFFWLLYRIKRMLTRMIRSKLIENFPQTSAMLEGFQQKIDYLNARMDSLGNKLNELEQKIKEP